MHLYVVLPASLFMIALGIALEIALHFSQKNQGECFETLCNNTSLICISRISRT